MVKRKTIKKSSLAKKKTTSKNKRAIKKRVVKRKVQPKKRASPEKKPAKKKAPPRRKAKIKEIALHKDGTEKFETTDVLFDSIINRGGRPTNYTKTIAKKICLLISMGFSLSKITSYPDMPVMSTVCLWLLDTEGKPELSEWYSQAREAQIDIIEDRVMDICMNVPKVPMAVGKDGDILCMDGKRIMVNHPANVALAKLQTDSHYKMLGSLRAKKWGRNIDLGEGVGDLLGYMAEAAERVANFKREAALIDGETGEVVES